MPRRDDQEPEPSEEVGATAGKTHAEVLEQALGRERGVKAATQGGPRMRASSGVPQED